MHVGLYIHTYMLVSRPDRYYSSGRSRQPASTRRVDRDNGALEKVVSDDWWLQARRCRPIERGKCLWSGVCLAFSVSVPPPQAADHDHGGPSKQCVVLKLRLVPSPKDLRILILSSLI